jgi:hypothetical protein
MPPKFKPKVPKPRKAKTAEEKAIIRKRNKAEDDAMDEVSIERRRKQAILKDPTLFLSGGLGSMAQNEILNQYNRVLAYNKAKEERPADPVIAPEPSAPSAPSASLPEPVNETPRFPPGVLIKKKNPNKAERAHNKEVRALQKRSQYIPEPIVSNVQSTPDVSPFSSYSFEQPVFKPIPDEYLRDNEIPEEIGSGPVSVNWAPDADAMMADLGDTGDYLYELGWYEQQTNQVDESGIKQNYVDILSSQREGRVVVPERERESDMVIRMTDEEKAQIIAQAKEIQGKMKQAKTQEEKDYYKRALKDLKEGETSAVKSRRKQREEALIASAPVAFKAQNVPKRKYWGPANIVNDMIQISREVSSRPLTDTEEQSYMGKGTTGQTERYTSDTYSDTFSVREYQPPEGSGVLKLRDLDNVPEWGIYDDKPAGTTDESGYEYPVEQLTRYMGSMERKKKAPKQRVLPPAPTPTLQVEEMAPSMLTKTGAGKYRYDTRETNAQIRTYGRKRDPKTGQYVKYKG